MEYNKPLSKCSCGRKPKLYKKPNYFMYSCDKCDLRTFWSQTELTSRELFNSMIGHIGQLKVRI